MVKTANQVLYILFSERPVLRHGKVIGQASVFLDWDALVPWLVVVGKDQDRTTIKWVEIKKMGM